MHGSVRRFDRRGWSRCPKIIAQSRLDKIIIIGSRTIERAFSERTPEEKEAVRPKYTQARLIMARVRSGGGCGPSAFSAEEFNTEMTDGGGGLPENYRRHQSGGRKYRYEINKRVYKLREAPKEIRYESIARVRSSAPSAWFCSTLANPGTLKLRSARPLIDMETRQKWRQAEEQQRAAEESRNRKGKIIMQEDPPVKVWLIEDDSEEEDTQGVASTGKGHHKKLAEEGKTDVKGDQPEAPCMQGSRRGRRSRNQNMGPEIDRACKRACGQKESEPAGESSRQGQGSNRRKKETVNHRIRRAEQAYRHYPNPAVRRVMQHLEEETVQGQEDDDMEDCEFLIHDPGHTRGRISLFKQSLHIYWVVKGLMAKALEQVAKEMVNLAKGEPDLRRELRFLRIASTKQEEQLDAMQLMLTHQGKQLDEIQQILRQDQTGPKKAVNQQEVENND